MLALLILINKLVLLHTLFRMILYSLHLFGGRWGKEIKPYCKRLTDLVGGGGVLRFQGSSTG